MTRKEANLAILAKLTRYVMLNDDERFGQILRNIGVIVDYSDVDWANANADPSPRWFNHFNEESTSILKRMEQTEKKEGLT